MQLCWKCVMCEIPNNNMCTLTFKKIRTTHWSVGGDITTDTDTRTYSQTQYFVTRGQTHNWTLSGHSHSSVVEQGDCSVIRGTCQTGRSYRLWHTAVQVAIPYHTEPWLRLLKALFTPCRPVSAP